MNGARAESSQSHLVPNRNGQPEAMQLRPETPLTSPPLRDDFDVFTQRWSRTTRVTTAAPTASGGFTEARRRKNKTSVDDPVYIADKLKSRREKKQSEPDSGGIAAPGRSQKRMRAKDRIKRGDLNGWIEPPAGQDYEIVNHQVLEEGPERTVSISTWREQAILDPDNKEGNRMSVYYVSAEDCLQLEYLEVDVSVPEPISPEVRQVSGTDSSSSSARRRDKMKEGSPEDRKELRPSLSEKMTPARGQSSTDAHRVDLSSEKGRILHSSVPRTSTPHGSGALATKNTPPETSNTIQDSASLKPFHATRSTSGSTISSIHTVAPTSTLEHVLLSCEPSLMHIAPILQRVGITGVEHLRAVARLSDETRNGEIREEVLRMGVTVVEWAILLDRLQSL
ncbi:hypothetical protein B0H10DRAFT_2013256 [Mycena sp. CBHHK59/15]|nr:hypothetical protein B0H10DRAFT_2013256 [Mycena sp. CBHHK59/15]